MKYLSPILRAASVLPRSSACLFSDIVPDSLSPARGRPRPDREGKSAGGHARSSQTESSCQQQTREMANDDPAPAWGSLGDLRLADSVLRAVQNWGHRIDVRATAPPIPHTDCSTRRPTIHLKRSPWGANPAVCKWPISAGCALRQIHV